MGIAILDKDFEVPFTDSFWKAHRTEFVKLVFDKLVFDSDASFGDLIEMFWGCFSSNLSRISMSTVSVVPTASASHCDALLLHYRPITNGVSMR